jgi:SAM-dependent methyltransferase
MLYHVPDRTRVYAEVLRVLKPGGRFFAATNDTHHMQEIAGLARAYRPELDRVFVAANERYPFDSAFAELGARFHHVQLHRFANRLIVTDAGALADYMLSGLHGGPPGHTATATASAAEIGDFRRWLAAEMAARGGRIEINPATGLFEAAKAP